MVAKVKESEIVREICDFLHVRGFFFWRQNNIPVFSDGRFRAMPKYARHGLPDIFVISYGEIHALEVKRPGNRATSRLSVNQAKFGADLVGAGGFYHVVRSVQEAAEALYVKDMQKAGVASQPLA